MLIKADRLANEVPMNSALWRKCDFQVHTPRDPYWTGERPLGIGDAIGETGKTANESDVTASRASWADKFVEECLSNNLQAVAVTDHNEMVMFSHIQDAIERRKHDDHDFDLWLFPGMELTANGGKQCIIIFDANLSVGWREQAQGKLGIEYAVINKLSAAGPKVSPLEYQYPDIAESLDKISGLRGNYIILPNVSQGNRHTVLIYAGKYNFRRIPYFGGYVDTKQDINTLTPKNGMRLSGKAKAWSAREIYPLPTSDSRSSDFAALGNNDAWIKLADSTAEAIRQAFLSHESRIRIEPPKTLSLVVTSIDVKVSTIILSAELNLSLELNSIIGGRGSGKSSFLEYLSFGLGRSCYDAPRTHYSGTDRLHGLIQDSLVSAKGSINLKIIQDGAVFGISRGQIVPISRKSPFQTAKNKWSQ